MSKENEPRWEASVPYKKAMVMLADLAKIIEIFMVSRSDEIGGRFSDSFVNNSFSQIYDNTPSTYSVYFKNGDKVRKYNMMGFFTSYPSNSNCFRVLAELEKEIPVWFYKKYVNKEDHNSMVWRHWIEGGKLPEMHFGNEGGCCVIV